MTPPPRLGPALSARNCWDRASRFEAWRSSRLIDNDRKSTGIGEVWSVASVNQVLCRTSIYRSFGESTRIPIREPRSFWSCSYILSSADAVAAKFIEFSNVSARRGSHRRPHKYAFDMRCISHLEMNCFPKNTEIRRRSFVRVGRLRGMIRQIASTQMDFIDHETLEFSPHRRCPRRAHDG
jgi:hypothetical protein